jgi:hypothetical protein
MKKMEEESDEDEPIPFEYQYPLSEAMDGGDPDINYKKNIVLTDTPKGSVYMRYSKDDEGFEYWADSAIDYKYLETVARKYVTVFACSDIYIDRFSLLKAKILKINEVIKENKKKEETEDKTKDKTEETEEYNPFVTLKSYNKKNKPDENKTIITRGDVVCDKANKYLNRGKIKEADFSEPEAVVETAASIMSFDSWKLWKNKDA